MAMPAQAQTATDEAASAGEGENTPPPAPPTTFGFEEVASLASERATRVYEQPVAEQVGSFANLTYDQYRAIRFRRDRDPFAGNPRFGMVLLPPGAIFYEPVNISIVRDGVPHRLEFDPSLLEFDPSQFPDGADLQNKGQMGWSGFRLRTILNRPGVMDEFLVFQGATYFRAVARGTIYGLSARGLAIKTGSPDGEEFPLFTDFWIQEPSETSEWVRIYALLDSKSVAGAYQFDVNPGASTIVRTRVALFPRVELQNTGLAPLTSMFWFGKNTPHVSPDWRPEVHDSDGLEILAANGERIWRPLNNPPGTMVNSFASPGVKGFGLMQRERDFAQYQDDGVFYERRASAWITPQGDWGDGAVVLTELRTDDEIHDNIVAFWQPAEPTAKGQSHDFAYRLDWVRDNPAASPIAHFTATRLGAGGVPGQPRPKGVVKVVCDFAGPNLAGLSREDGLTIKVTTGQAQVSNTAVYPVVGTNYWRTLFDLSFAENDQAPIDLRAYVDHKGMAMTETLILQLFPSQLRTLLARTP